MLHYILKDFQSMFKTEKYLVILLICIQLLSTIVIYFSYGVTNHYNTQIGVTEGTDLSYSIQLVNMEEEYMSLQEIHNFHESLILLFENKIEAFITLCEYECQVGNNKTNCSLASSVKYVDGKYTAGSKHFYDVVLVKIKNDAYIYNEDEYIIEQFDKEEQVVLMDIYELSDETSIYIDDIEFKIVGIFDGMPFVYMPYSQIPNNGEYNLVGFTLSKPLLETEYETLVQVVEQSFGDKAEVYEEFNGVKNENQYRVYRGIIAILSIFVVMSGLNYCVIYTHLLDKRRRMLAASRVCGCTSFKAVIIYMLEFLSISILTLIGGLLIFIYGIMPNIKTTFEYMEYYFNAQVYAEIALVYVSVLIILYLAIVLRYVRKTPIRLIREV